MKKVNALIGWAEDNPLKCALTLFLFHLALSSVLYAIACSPYLASMHDGHGLWNFSLDSHQFNQWAIQRMQRLQSGDISGWWNGQFLRYPHIKWIALSYFLLSAHPIAFAPVNAFIWGSTVFTAYALARQMMPDSRVLAAIGTMIFVLMPSYLFQTTQLLQDPFYVLGVGMLLLGAVRLLQGVLKWPSIALFTVGIWLCLVFRPYMWIAFLLMVFTVVFVVIVRTRSPRVVLAVVILVLVVGKGSWIMSSAYQPSLIFGDHISSSVTQEGLNRLAHALQRARAGFYHSNAGSKIDTDVVFSNWTDVLSYIPRALQLGLMSPFPDKWLHSDHSSSWKGARLLAGMEMTILYTLIVGFAIFICCGPIPLYLRLFLLIFSLSFLILIAMAIPIVGIIYRMRYAYLMPIILAGLYGWWIALSHNRFCRKLIDALTHLRSQDA